MGKKIKITESQLEQLRVSLKEEGVPAPLGDGGMNNTSMVARLEEAIVSQNWEEVKSVVAEMKASEGKQEGNPMEVPAERSEMNESLENLKKTFKRLL